MHSAHLIQEHNKILRSSLPHSISCTSKMHQKSFKIKHDEDKFFSRRVSKESSNSNPSFRIYYGDVPSAVPFTWESRPGTPKHTFSDSFDIPPLTPPPSYYTNNSMNYSKKSSRSKLLFHTLLRRMNPKKVHQSSSSSPTSSSSISWSSSSRSSFSDLMTMPDYVNRRRRFSSWGSSFDAKATKDNVCGSKLCFGIGKDSGGRLHGGYSVLFVKKALLSIVGRGSAA